MACTDVAKVKAKATAINLIILSSYVTFKDLACAITAFRKSLSSDKKNREGQNIVDARTSDQFAIDRTPKALFARVPGGNTGT